MAGPTWLVDGNRFATKIKNASAACETGSIKWKSNPCRACPNCHHTIDNSDVAQEWPGLPRGVKFDPSDQEIMWHLLTKAGTGDLKPHPLIDEFILTVKEDDGICYTHPQNLPDVKQDGSVSHFFHRAIKAYNTGTRKRRKIHGDDFGDVRWHKTGRTKPVILNGIQRGCKKVMVLYVSTVKGGKAEKTNWVMHQYHLGTEEDEKDGDYVISKIFYQQQQVKQSDKGDEDFPEIVDAMITKVDPVTPKSTIPDPPRSERQYSEVQKSAFTPIESLGQYPQAMYVEDKDNHTSEKANYQNILEAEDHSGQVVENDDNQTDAVYEEDEHHASEMTNYQNVLEEEDHSGQGLENNDNEAEEDSKWWDSESQYLLSSQQLVEGLSICDELLQSQSPNRDGNVNCENSKRKPRLSDYAHLGPEDLKRDLEACQNLVPDLADIELDTPPDFRLSQLEFGSQDSFLAWGGNKAAD